jgi:cation-transporting ATPase 13A2
MENKVKPATNPTIKILNDCNIRTIMATGDNILTAIAVGKECNILSNDLVNVYFGDI